MKFKIGMVVLCLSVLSACDSGSNDPVVQNDPSKTDPPKTVADGANVDNTSVQNVAPKNIVEAPVPPVLTDGPPIATTQQTNGKARVNVLSLKRTEGDTMTLRYVVINDNSRGNLQINRDYVQILDIVNRRRYEAGLSSECYLRAEQQQLCWAIFAAPKDNPQMLSVVIRAVGDPPFDIVSVPFSSN